VRLTWSTHEIEKALLCYFRYCSVGRSYDTQFFAYLAKPGHRAKRASPHTYDFSQVVASYDSFLALSLKTLSTLAIMEKSGSYSERIETVSASSPAMSDAEKQHYDDAVGANLELDESSLPPGYFRSKFFVGSMAGIGLGLMAGVVSVRE
jgi:hypothetical protein